MTDLTGRIEFRRCQKCGQVEKVTTAEVVVAGRHPDHCDNKQENWVHFTAEPDWRPIAAAPGALLLLHFRGCAIIPANESKAGDDSAHTGVTSSTAALPAGAAVASRRSCATTRAFQALMAGKSTPARWSMRNERELIQLAKTQSLEAIAKRLKRSPEFIRAKAVRLGVSIRRGAAGT